MVLPFRKPCISRAKPSGGMARLWKRRAVSQKMQMKPLPAYGTFFGMPHVLAGFVRALADEDCDS